MVQEQTPQPYDRRVIRTLRSKGHTPPVDVVEEIPTYEAILAQAFGGPGCGAPRAAGSNPWVAGSMTLGSNQVLNLNLIKLAAGSANMHFFITNNHSGSNPTAPGGTLDDFWFPAADQLVLMADHLEPIRSYRTPGTYKVLVFGGKKSSAGSTPYAALPGSASHIFMGALVKGWIESAQE